MIEKWALVIEYCNENKKKFHGLYDTKQEAINAGCEILGAENYYELPDEINRIDHCRVDWSEIDINKEGKQQVNLIKSTIKVKKVNEEDLIRPNYLCATLSITNEELEEYYSGLKDENKN